MDSVIDTKVAGLILAAGKGTRMKSDLPKGLHAVCGLPMVECVGRAMIESGIRRPVVVVGHGADKMRASLGEEKYDYVLQDQQLGTGHAALMAKDTLANWDGPVIIAPGDAPLVTGDAFKTLADHHIRTGAKVTVVTCVLDDPRAYGRIVRDDQGRAMAIVEEKDASEEQRRIKEVCVSVYCFDAETLFAILPTLSSENAQGEYYLTDIVAKVYTKGDVVETLVFNDPELLLGVNDRWQLAEVSQIMNRRILRQHCMNGVSVIDPATTWIGADVRIGVDTTILPMTLLEGSTAIGSESVIGPMTRILDSEVGDECVIHSSRLDRAIVGDGVKVGPFANLRPKTVLSNRVKIGNFVEIKNAELHDSVSVSHLTYVGDAEVGEGTNIGAGTITCNFDGFIKSTTKIGKGAFVGSNSTLIAPIEIGDGAVIGAGSVIDDDVPPDALALGRAKQEVKEQWAKQWRERKKSAKV